MSKHTNLQLAFICLMMIGILEFFTLSVVLKNIIYGILFGSAIVLFYIYYVKKSKEDNNKA